VTFALAPSKPRPAPAAHHKNGGEEGGPAVVSDGPDDVAIVTFGCRLNAYESEAIRARAAADGLPTRWCSTPAR
jgi:threonylcarbamoyladenosine tRNA methylthiotransferase MtaB